MRRALAFIVCAIALLMEFLWIAGWRPGDGTGLYGHWVKASVESDSPDQLTIRRDGDYLIIRHFDGGGRTTWRLLCDGAEHQFEKIAGFQMWYRAKCDDNSLLLTQRFQGGATTSEKWAASDGSRTMVIQQTVATTTYRRPSFFQRLMVGAP